MPCWHSLAGCQVPAWIPYPAHPTGSFHPLCSSTPSRDTLPPPPMLLMSQRWGLIWGGGSPLLKVWRYRCS